MARPRTIRVGAVNIVFNRRDLHNDAEQYFVLMEMLYREQYPYSTGGQRKLVIGLLSKEGPLSLMGTSIASSRSIQPAGGICRVGVSEGTIRQLESGVTKNPAFTVGLRLADAQGVDPFWLGLGDGASLNERMDAFERRLADLERGR